jgi:hypothetical protein
LFPGEVAKLIPSGLPDFGGLPTSMKNSLRAARARHTERVMQAVPDVSEKAPSRTSTSSVDVVRAKTRPTERQDAYWYRRFTPETQRMCLDAVKSGLSLTGVAGKAGISPKALLSWLDRGLDDSDSPYHTFAIKVLSAQAEFEEMALRKGGSGRQRRAAICVLIRGASTRDARVLRRRSITSTGAGRAATTRGPTYRLCAPHITVE